MLDLSQPVIEQLRSPEEATNYIHERIDAVRQQMQRNPGPPTDELTSVEYLKWERRFLIEYGRAIGALQALQAFSKITIPMFEQMKNSLMGALLVRTADVQMGK
jgi:hypothetical protein